MFRYKIEQIRISTDFSDKTLRNKIARVLEIFPSGVKSVKILSKSVDARKKPPVNVVSAEIVLEKEPTKNLKFLKPIENSSVNLNFKISKNAVRPVIVGFGPAGISAAYFLSKIGAKPIVFERGERISQREKKTYSFWNDGILDENSNVLFGEGGAGLFSDGKLTSRSKDAENRKLFLEMLVRHGADKNILTDTRAHIGTDILSKILKSIREEIEESGGEIKFGSQLTDIKIAEKKLVGIYINGEFFETQNLILAIGHSARDTCKTLKKYLDIFPKPFAIGVRVEFEQEVINRLQYGKFKENLPAASFSLTFKAQKSAFPCYTFCMCPGGRVIACSAQNGLVSTNGMSYSQRSLSFANAAFLVPVSPESFLSAYDFLEDIERKSFEKGGRNYALPAQNLASFLYEKDNNFNYELSPHRYKIADINGILPEFVEKTLKTAIPQMLSSMGKIQFERAAVFAAETGSSSPVRIMRNADTFESVSVKNIFPCGEGAGFAGGIVSSGIDGIRCAKIYCEA